MLRAASLLLILGLFGAFLYFIFQSRVPNNIPPEESQVTTNIVETSDKITFEGLIASVNFATNCEILVTSTNQKTYNVGNLASSGMNNPKCITKPKYEISDSGKYLVFEDVSGGVDLWIRVFSVTTKSLDTIGVWGTSSLLDLEFLNDDKIAILSGYPDIPIDQWLNLYNLPELYSDYPKNIDENHYFKWEILSSKNVDLPIETVPGDFFRLSRDSANLKLLGGTQSKQVLRGTFPLKNL